MSMTEEEKRRFNEQQLAALNRDEQAKKEIRAKALLGTFGPVGVNIKGTPIRERRTDDGTYPNIEEEKAKNAERTGNSNPSIGEVASGKVEVEHFAEGTSFRWVAAKKPVPVKQVIKCSPNTHTSINLGHGCMVLVPTEQLIVSIYNNTPFMKNFEEKTILIEGVWDNGDGVEVQIRRVPKREV